MGWRDEGGGTVVPAWVKSWGGVGQDALAGIGWVKSDGVR